MGSSNRIVSNALGDITNALEKTKNSTKEDLSPGTLPPVFIEVAPYIPVAHGVFNSCKNYVASLENVEFEEAMCQTLKRCETRAVRLDKIFQDIIFESNAKERYPQIAEGEPLEALMKSILGTAIELAKSGPFADVIGANLEDLEQALRKIEALLPSLPESCPSYAFINSGSGYINASTGNGDQNNNNGSGNQFNGAIHNFHSPAREPLQG